MFYITYLSFSYQPTQVDVAVFDAVSKSPTSSTPHAQRWYNHIKSYSNEERKKFTGEKKLPSSLGTTSQSAAAPKSAAKADDDDVDLFGSDEEEVSFKCAFKPEID